jgi:hypothetical protein
VQDEQTERHRLPSVSVKATVDLAIRDAEIQNLLAPTDAVLSLC